MNDDGRIGKGKRRRYGVGWRCGVAVGGRSWVERAGGCTKWSKILRRRAARWAGASLRGPRPCRVHQLDVRRLRQRAAQRLFGSSAAPAELERKNRRSKAWHPRFFFGNLAACDSRRSVRGVPPWRPAVWKSSGRSVSQGSQTIQRLSGCRGIPPAITASAKSARASRSGGAVASSACPGPWPAPRLPLHQPRAAARGWLIVNHKRVSAAECARTTCCACAARLVPQTTDCGTPWRSCRTWRAASVSAGSLWCRHHLLRLQESSPTWPSCSTPSVRACDHLGDGRSSVCPAWRRGLNIGPGAAPAGLGQPDHNPIAGCKCLWLLHQCAIESRRSLPQHDPRVGNPTQRQGRALHEDAQGPEEVDGRLICDHHEGRAPASAPSSTRSTTASPSTLRWSTAAPRVRGVDRASPGAGAWRRCRSRASRRPRPITALTSSSEP